MSESIKKRGRKKKETPVEPNIQVSIIEEESISTPNETAEVCSKKRGRKPKGGKLISKQLNQMIRPNTVANVILHLKCSLKDLNEYNDKINEMVKDPLSYNPIAPPDIMTYNDVKSDYFVYDNIEQENTNTNQNNQIAYSEILCKKCNETVDPSNMEDAELDENVNMKDINSKLKKLRIQLYKNTLNDKKSACFWCSYEFDNQPCYIPKYEIDDTICGYGSFCRPECAVGFLMKESIDDSTKFERYHLLNQIYSKVYGFTKNIKPAPNPYYLLDKFYGNLSIQEYRKLLKTEHMLLVIDKPLTRILPELHEDNDEFIMNIYGGVKTNQPTKSGGIYKVKRQSEKQQGPTKNSIMRNKFGLS